MKIYLFCLFVILCSCSGRSKDGFNPDIVAVADSFALNYFNLDIPSSAKYCTPGPKRLLRFYAGNVSEEDLAVLQCHDEPASCEIIDVAMQTDTSAVVKCKVSDFLKIGDIDKAGEMADDEVFCIPVVRRGGRWLVKMEAPLRSGRQSRD